jgi:hypothetical protein
MSFCLHGFAGEPDSLQFCETARRHAMILRSVKIRVRHIDSFIPAARNDH